MRDSDHFFWEGAPIKCGSQARSAHSSRSFRKRNFLSLASREPSRNYDSRAQFSKMLNTIQSNSELYSTYADSPRLVSIAPAPEKYTTLGDMKGCNSRSNSYVGAQAASIARRNARERNRVKQVNDGYNALRKRLPAAIVSALSGGPRRGSGKKLSKVDTLKMVVEYIRYMERIIEDSDAAVVGVKNTAAASQREDEEIFGGSSPAFRVKDTAVSSQHEDEGVFGGRSSPYSDTVPSPVGSDSSGVYSAYSNSGCYQNTPLHPQLSPLEEDDLMDAISWWQEK